MHILFTLLSFYGGGDIMFEDIYQPLEPKLVAMTASQDIYILDSASAQVLHYNRKGEPIGTYSRRGQGPGELNQPVAMQLFDDALYVTDLGRGISQFNLDGTFVKSHKTKIGTFPQRVKSGWLYLDVPMDPKESPGLVWVNENFKDATKLYEYPRGEQQLGIMINPDKSVTINYNPVMDQALVVVAANGRDAYLYVPLENKIFVINTDTRKITSSLKIPGKKRLFNEGWGERKAAKVADNVTVNGQKVKPEMKVTYPTHFPILADMRSAPTQGLWVSPGESFLNPKANLLILAKDSLTPHFFNSEAGKRVVGMDGDKAYVLMFDKVSETAGIRVLAVGEVNDYVLTHGNSVEAEEDQVLAITTM